MRVACRVLRRLNRTPATLQDDKMSFFTENLVIILQVVCWKSRKTNCTRTKIRAT